ncbi:alpha/beta fold hydrolase [Streptomyces sp. NPDC002138]|uniref:alpha/beta fold hydrolase n=1 Tax=Streptomyces sp. NPDC002138 TaxID=3154410 RepID=UPI003327CDCE
MRQRTDEPARAQGPDVHGVPVSSDGRLWAEHRGAGSPVVLLHGAGMDARLWDHVVPELALHHSVVRFDARGLGRSTSPEAPFDDVEDLLAVLDHFGLDQAALVGLSMGGETALDFTLAHPGRVTALVLVAASVSGHDWPRDPDSAAYSAARRDRDAARLAELELSIWAPLGDTAPGGELIRSMIEDNAQRRIVSEGHFADLDRDAAAVLEQVSAATLVIHGDHDHPEIAVIADRLVADIPDARRELVSGADHYLPLRTPARLTELLLAHLVHLAPSRRRQQPTPGPTRRVRPRTDSDLDECVRVLAAVHARDGYPMNWPDSPGDWLTPPSLFGAWVVEVDGRIVGHIGLSHGAADDAAAALWSRREGESSAAAAVVNRLFVAPTARGQGIGALLMDHVTRAARERDLHPVLDVVASDTSAAALYERLGWELLATVEQRWDPGQTVTVRCYAAAPATAAGVDAAAAAAGESRPGLPGSS